MARIMIWRSFWISLFALFAAPAAADDYVRFLDVRCDPAISVFSVREGGTSAFDGPFDNVIRIDRDATRVMDPEHTTLEQGDLMARCLLGQSRWVFDVRRIGFQPGNPTSGMCTGADRATFAITLNGRLLSRWEDGMQRCISPHDDLPPARARSVSFDGDRVEICTPVSEQLTSTEDILTIECKSRSIDQILSANGG